MSLRAGWTRNVRRTMPILSAYFLLNGRVSLLTSVPSGYKMNVRGVSCFSARWPSHESDLAR